jgi:hypothetical protein
MTVPHLTFQILPVPTAIALIVTALLAYALGRRLELWPAVLIAGSAVPVAVVGIGIYHAAAAGPDDAPRAWILIVTAGVAAATSAVTLIVSRLAVGFARR